MEAHLFYFVIDFLQSVEDCIELLKTSIMPIMLRPSLRTPEKLPREQQAALGVCGKVDRVFEKLRRTAVKYLEAHPVSSSSEALPVALDAALRKLLSECISCLQSVLAFPVSFCKHHGRMVVLTMLRARI